MKEKVFIEKNEDFFLLSPKFTPWYHYKLQYTDYKT